MTCLHSLTKVGAYSVVFTDSTKRVGTHFVMFTPPIRKKSERPLLFSRVSPGIYSDFVWRPISMPLSKPCLRRVVRSGGRVFDTSGCLKPLFLRPFLSKLLVVRVTEISVEILRQSLVDVTPSVGGIPFRGGLTVFSTAVFFPRIRIVSWETGAKARHSSRRSHFHDFFVYDFEAEHFAEVVCAR